MAITARRMLVLSLLVAATVAVAQPVEPAIDSSAPAPEIRPALASPTTKPAPGTTQPALVAADDRVEALVRQLGDDSWRDRQKAQDQLVQMGEKVRPRLGQLLNQTADEEIRTRVEAILRQLDENRVAGTSMITIHMKAASPREVFAEIGRQAYTELRPSPNNLWESRVWPKVDIDIDNRPFWEAMREACTKFGVSPQNAQNAERDLFLVEGTGISQLWGPNCPTAIAGAFMVVATTINCNYMIDLNNPKAINRNANVQFVVYAEPKMRVLQGSYYAKLDEVVDDKGNSIAVRTPFDQMNPPRELVWRLWCQIQPQPASTRVTKLKASARFVLQTRAESAEIANPLSAAGTEKVVGGRKFKLKAMTRNGDMYVVQMTFHRSGWSQVEWNSMYNLNMSGMVNFKLVDAQGNRFTRVNMNPRGGSTDAIDIDIQFQRANWAGGANPVGEPAKLTWDMPIETREVNVPFEFRDLPLP